MAAAKKPVAKKVVAKKPVAKKTTVKKPAAKKVVAVKPSGVKKPRVKKVVEPTVVDQNAVAKAAATKAGEPWVSVLSVELDVDNIGNGAMQLDWNDFFVARLVKAGYKGTDVDMVDMWFASLCRSVLEQNWEQEMSDPEKREEFNRKNPR